MTQSISQNYIKKALTLLEGKGRNKNDLFIVEGEKFISEIPDGWPVECFIISEGFAGKHDVSVYENKARVRIAADHQYKKLSDTVTPQGIMAICGKRTYTLDSLPTENCLLLLCEAVSDPGNAGALIRTADAAGAAGVILTIGCADLYCPKVIRASAGSLFHLPCVVGADAAATASLLKSRGVLLAAARLNGDILPYDTDLRRACCIMIGNEARGLSPGISALADIVIKIPMLGGAESLNAAAAGSVLLYEAVRQRLL
ncbi:MAG: RNA methyltransferase [Clostridiales bacterium]|jgi:TrmH family RNA methyltransferase|nr:RNA methyltransferase [Clostridiales bacterium]